MAQVFNLNYIQHFYFQPSLSALLHIQGHKTTNHSCMDSRKRNETIVNRKPIPYFSHQNSKKGLCLQKSQKPPKQQPYEHRSFPFFLSFFLALSKGDMRWHEEVGSPTAMLAYG